ncbi:MAG: hypothetical protein JXR81_02680 [Candidatus Goldbacteria bacterium]|nr:hypothetical protein [Candidatus Goldiibacteriota bacterium]
MTEENASLKETPKTPKTVELAVLFTFLAIMTGMTEFILELAGIGQQTIEMENYEMTAIIGFAINFIFMILFLKKQNWARILFTVFFFLGLLALVPIVKEEFKSDLIGAASSILQTVFVLIAIMLLFSKSSNTWFKKNKTAIQK